MYRPSVSSGQFYESVALYYLLQVIAHIFYLFVKIMIHMAGPPYDRTCYVHPIGDPEWTSDYQHFSDKDMCSPCILCQDIPDPPPVNGDSFEDARFMEWYESWRISVTDEDRTNCIC